MTGFLTATELVYARRTPILGNLTGGFPEHWDIAEPSGAIVATVEEEMSALERAARFLSSRFARKQRHRLEVRDPEGRPLLLIVKPTSRMGLEYAEVRAADGTPAGTIRLVGSDSPPGVGLGLYNPHDVRLGEVGQNREKSDASGYRTYDLLTAEGARIGEFASTTTRGGTDSSGFRLQVADGLGEPLRSLVRAAPIVRYFLLP